MLRKRKNRSGSHSLFERSHLFKKYGFIEALVILIFWIVVICFSLKNEKPGIKALSGISMHCWFWPDTEGFGSYIPGFLHLLFVLGAIIINIYKRFKVCNSLSCYLGETDEEKFKKERKVLNMATGISSIGLISAVPIIYFLSFLFRIIFLRFVRKEEKNSREEDIF